MLDNDRKRFVTASQAHRVMAGFEAELAGRKMEEPPLFDAISKFMQKEKPLVGDLKKAGIMASGKEIQSCWDYYKATKPVFSEGMESVAREIAMGEFISDRDNYVSDDMENGNLYEAEAVLNLSNIVTKNFSNTGDRQLFFSKGNIGATPDGVFYEGFDISECAEVKCPKDTTHMRYLVGFKSGLTLLQIEPKYYWQAQAGLYVTGAKAYNWASYHRNFIEPYKMIYQKIEPDHEHIEILIERSEKVLTRAKDIIELINASNEPA